MTNTNTETAVNKKEIIKKETSTKSRWNRFLCEVTINNTLRRQWTSDLIEYIAICNDNGWYINQVTFFVAPRVREIPANYDLYNKC